MFRVCGYSLRRSLLLPPVVAESHQSGKRFTIFDTASSHLTGDDVVGVANRKSGDINVPLPSIFKTIDSIGGKNQVQVERSIFQLDEIPASFYVCNVLG